jgi:hypothetical protein
VHDLESTLRATLADRAAEAPTGDDLVDVVRRRGGVQRTRRRIAGTAIALGIGVAVVAISDLNPFRPDHDIVITAPGRVAADQITCGSDQLSFDPDILVERPPLDPDSELGTAVRTTARPPVAARLIDGWTLLDQVGPTAHLMIWLKSTAESTNMAGSGMIVATYRQANDGTWDHESSGECQPQRAFDDGLNPATWALPGARPGPEATSITILVTERACASGQSSEGRLADPIVEYRDDAVLITTRVEPPVGDVFNCLGNPATEVTVELDEPLGDRQLLDGMWFPARPVQEAERR